jgi:hypothetical protein
MGFITKLMGMSPRGTRRVSAEAFARMLQVPQHDTLFNVSNTQ